MTAAEVLAAADTFLTESSDLLLGQALDRAYASASVAFEHATSSEMLACGCARWRRAVELPDLSAEIDAGYAYPLSMNVRRFPDLYGKWVYLPSAERRRRNQRLAGEYQDRDAVFVYVEALSVSR